MTAGTFYPRPCLLRPHFRVQSGCSKPVVAYASDLKLVPMSKGS